MLQIPLWNRILIVLVVLAGLSFAMPNLFYERVERTTTPPPRSRRRGDDDANAEALAGWPDFLPSTLVNLGLDLRGGAHLLAEVRSRMSTRRGWMRSGPRCGTRCATCATRWARSAGSMRRPVSCMCA
jgi:preprotein translocase subunit SecD